LELSDYFHRLIFNQHTAAPQKVPPWAYMCYSTGLTLATPAPIERICSILNSMRSDNKSRMLKQNVTALITSKINADFSSCDFYEKIKSNKDFLKKMLFTEKHDWPNM